MRGLVLLCAKSLFDFLIHLLVFLLSHSIEGQWILYCHFTVWIRVAVFIFPPGTSCGVSQSFGAAYFAFPFCVKTNGPRVQDEPLRRREGDGEKGTERERERVRETSQAKARISLRLLSLQVLNQFSVSLVGYSVDQVLRQLVLLLLPVWMCLCSKGKKRADKKAVKREMKWHKTHLGYFPEPYLHQYSFFKCTQLNMGISCHLTVVHLSWYVIRHSSILHLSLLNQLPDLTWGQVKEVLWLKSSPKFAVFLLFWPPLSNSTQWCSSTVTSVCFFRACN